MTRDEIIEMARRSGLTKFVGNYDQSFSLESFAKLVAQHEREACLKLADSLGWVNVDHIKARGQA